MRSKVPQGVLTHFIDTVTNTRSNRERYLSEHLYHFANLGATHPVDQYIIMTLHAQSNCVM